MSKITNDGLTLTRSVTGCFKAVPIWQQLASEGWWTCRDHHCRCCPL